MGACDPAHVTNKVVFMFVLHHQENAARSCEKHQKHRFHQSESVTGLVTGSVTGSVAWLLTRLPTQVVV